MLPPSTAVADPDSATLDWVLAHHPLGASTGYMSSLRGDWGRLAAGCLDVSVFAAELSALSEEELPGLLEFMRDEPPLPFGYLSVHAPVKGRRLPERELVALLVDACGGADTVVVHPDVMDDASAYRPLGRVLTIENMDGRKPSGRTVAELAPLFEELPDAGFCFDVAHAVAVDPSLRLAGELLDAFGCRLREVHISSLDAAGRHIPLTKKDLGRFERIMRRCPDVPWILEAPLPAV